MVHEKGKYFWTILITSAVYSFSLYLFVLTELRLSSYMALSSNKGLCLIYDNDLFHELG